MLSCSTMPEAEQNCKYRPLGGSTAALAAMAHGPNSGPLMGQLGALEAGWELCCSSVLRMQAYNSVGTLVTWVEQVIAGGYSVLMLNTCRRIIFLVLNRTVYQYMTKQPHPNMLGTQ